MPVKSHLTSWVNHVKSWANAHNMKYFQALKTSECRDAYKNKGTTTEAVSEVKPKRKYVRKTKIDNNTPPELPNEILNVIKKRSYKRKNIVKDN